MSRTTEPDTVKLALVQMTCTADKAANVDKALSRIDDAAAGGAQIVCLQELFAGEYFCQSEDETYFADAEPIPGGITDVMCAKAKERGVVLVVSLFEKRAPGLFHNSAVVIDADGSLLGTYRKMHIPDDPSFYEKYYFTPGDLGFKVWDTAFGRIGVLICWDQWFPEAARLTAMMGAKVLFYPTAIGWLPSEKAAAGEAQHSSWETIQRSHAIANGVYVASVNRTGHEAPAGGEGIEFWGQSFVADPSGTIMTKASAGNEEIIYADVEMAKIEAQRVTWPFFRDRRIDAYGGVSERFLD